MEAFPVLTRTLDNGFNVLVWEVKESPCASVWLLFRVGSGHEGPGITGCSHWVEHMLFQGGIEFTKGEIFKAIARVGGYNNGFTSKHITVYFETLPAEHVDLGMRIEADRALNSRFDPQETERERTVIISERQGGDNFPERLLDEEVDLAALRAHPYRWSVIGHMSDLKTMTRDDLYGYYRRHYTAENSALIVAGSVNADAIFARAGELFGKMPKGEARVRFTEEPEQYGPREIELRRPGTTHYIEVACRAPGGSGPDAAAMTVLDGILSGAKSFGMGGGSGGRTSRLYRRLVSGGLASSAWSHYGPTPEPYLFKAGVTVLEGASPARAEKALIGELDKMRDSGPTKAEVEKVRRQLAAAIARGLDGTTNKAYLLVRGEAFGDWTLSYKAPEMIEAVTVEQVKEIAGRVLAVNNRTTGRAIPTGEGGAGGAGGGSGRGKAAAGRAFFYMPQVCFATGGSATPGAAPAKRPMIPGLAREELANGIVLLTAPRKGTGLVAVRGYLGAGSSAEPPGKAGLASFSAAAAQRGTEKHSYREIFERLDRVGATFSMWESRHRMEFSASALSRDASKTLSTLAEVLRKATFPADEVEKVRGEMVTALRQDEEDPGAVASRELRKRVFGAAHPLGHPAPGEISTVSGITREELAGWLSSVASPRGLTVAVCGDVTHAQVKRWVEESFGDWDAPAPREPEIPPPAPSREPLPRNIAIPGKSQSDIAMGFPGLPRSHADYYAYAQATHILGRMGLMGRLGDRVRDGMGLAYYVYASAPSDPTGDLWTIHAGVNPANVEKALAAIGEELARIRAEEVSDAEFSDCQTNLVGSGRISLESCSQVAGALASVEFLKLGLDYFDRYEEYVRSVSKAAILEAARRHFREDGTIVVAG